MEVRREKRYAINSNQHDYVLIGRLTTEEACLFLEDDMDAVFELKGGRYDGLQCYCTWIMEEEEGYTCELLPLRDYEVIWH